MTRLARVGAWLASGVIAAAFAGAASARRPATASEHKAISAAVRTWDAHDGQSGLAGRWAVMHRCDTENVVVSSIDSRWAALSFRAKWFPPETDPRYQKCRRDGATVDGVWLAKRTASGWVGKAWVYGDLEPSSLCHILSTAGMPRRVFTELDEFERTC